MDIDLKNMHRRRINFVLWPALILLAGCFSEVTPIKRPNSSTQRVNKVSNLDLIEYYRSEKYPMVIKSAASLLKEQPENWEARLFQGLAYFNYGDIDSANQSFGQIPEHIRHNMVDSCLELQNLNSPTNLDKLRGVATKFFKDCLTDLKKPSQISEEIRITDEVVLKYGKLYDESISGEDDPDIRKLKEQKFLQTHSLTEDQLSEITAQYLELIAED